MDKKSKPPIIEVSFKKKEYELYCRICMRCEFINLAGWLKEAAIEKLEREDNHVSYNKPVENNTPIKFDGLSNMLNIFE